MYKDGGSPDISPPMALDLRDVRQPAHREPEELPVQRARDGLADRGLAHAGRAGEADDLALHRPAELAHGKELEDAVLDVLQPVVVLVEDTLGVGDRVVLTGVLAPRDLGYTSSARGMLAYNQLSNAPE